MGDKSEPRKTKPKHDAVFDAAKAVFIKFGFENASMDEIARFGGVTKATVYAHAGSKADLFRKTIVASLKLGESEIEPPDTAKPPEAALEQFCARFVGITSWSLPVALQRTILATVSQFPEHGRLAIELIHEKAVRLLGGYLEELRVPQPESAAIRLLDAATASRRTRILMGAENPVDGPTPSGKSLPSAHDRVLKQAVHDFCRLHQL
jgi:TetR/AcrR family transcriptional regulator, mexJK operon transcriptional repressor